MIQFHNVSKHYLNGHRALTNISFSLEKGEMAFLTGHSGAGKSTLLRLIMMMEPVSRGQIIVSGKNITRMGRRHVPFIRRHIGMVFQDPKLLMGRSVFDNVALPLFIQGYRRAEIGKRVRSALDKVKLLDKEKYYPNDLSTGEQQRLGIARAVVTRPAILLADEPTGNLDPELSVDIMKLFAECNNVGTSVLIVTHNLPLIASLPYRMMRLHQGRLTHGADDES